MVSGFTAFGLKSLSVDGKLCFEGVCMTGVWVFAVIVAIVCGTGIVIGLIGLWLKKHGKL